MAEQKKTSLFAQRMQNAKLLQNKKKEKMLNVAMPTTSCDSNMNESSCSNIVTGSDAEAIHKENTKRLSLMKLQEIEDERNRLLSVMNPALIEFIRSKKSQSQPKDLISTSNITTCEREMPLPMAELVKKFPHVDTVIESEKPISPSHTCHASVDFDESSSSDKVNGFDAEAIHKENTNHLSPMELQEIEEERNHLLSSQTHQKDQICTPNITTCESEMPLPVAELVNQFPHMDTVESEKVKWMEELPPPKPPSPGDTYNARFDFQGELLPFYKDQGVDGLYHHGEEPQRPGYTLQELLHLSRSSVIQHRRVALTTLANIFKKASEYESCLAEPILPQILQSEICLMLRFSLDDPVKPVSSAALAALTSLITNKWDEYCMDCLLGLTSGIRQPCFYVQLDSGTEQLKDEELLKLDVIEGLLKTRLLNRLTYLLNNVDFESVDAVHIVSCLTRIARHSSTAATKISTTPDLMDTVKKILHETREFPAALKLFRVMALQSRDLANDLIQRWDLMGSLKHFISENTKMSLVVESFYTWQVLLTYHLPTAVQETVGFMPIFQRLIGWNLNCCNLAINVRDLEYCTALMGVVGRILTMEGGEDMFHSLDGLITCALKLFTEALQMQDFRWSVGKLLNTTLSYVVTLIKLAEEASLPGFSPSRQSLHGRILHFQSLGSYLTIFNEKLMELMDSTAFYRSTLKLRECSWLLKSKELSCRTVDSLPCLGLPPPPSLSDNSPFPLIIGVATYVLTTESPQLAEKLMKSEGIKCYLEEVLANSSKITPGHWFAEQENTLIYSLLHIHLIAKVLDNSLIHELGLFLSTSISKDDKHLLADLFQNIIFNKELLSPTLSDLPSQMENLNMCDPDDGKLPREYMNEALNSLERICITYQGQFCLYEQDASILPQTMTASQVGAKPYLPADWPYELIVFIKSNERQYDFALKLVSDSLQWIFVLGCLRPKFFARLNPAAQFCRLACVLLAENDIFHDVRIWMGLVLRIILEEYKLMDFAADIPGLESFYDFYREIIIQYLAVSYGDPIFGQFVLIPLQQRHPVKLRKLIWCEYIAVTRFLSIPEHEIGIPFEEFLKPGETDPELLHSYLKSLANDVVTERYCPVLYKAAVHHIATYISPNCHQPSYYEPTSPNTSDEIRNRHVVERLQHLVQSLNNQMLKDKILNYNFHNPYSNCK